MEGKYRVGIVGLSPGRGWAATAHIPALRALSEVFELAGVANTSLASAQAAAAAFDIPRAFESAAALAASPDIDIVVVTVKVQHHKEVVTAALQAGKSVYSEWPLGNGLEETIALAELAREKKALAVVGAQAIASPEVQFMRKLVADGKIGDVLSSTYVGSGFSWGDDIPQGDAYAMDNRNGATLLSVIGGHAIAAIDAVLGDIEQIDAVLSQRRQTVRVIETGETVEMNTPDHLMANAILRSGAPLSLQLRGGLPRGRSCCGRSTVARAICASPRGMNTSRRSTSPPCAWSSDAKARTVTRNSTSRIRSRSMLAMPLRRAMSPAFTGCSPMTCAMERARRPASITHAHFTKCSMQSSSRVKRAIGSG